MGNYSDDADSVRVDFFKQSGKWYTTEAVKWTGSYHSRENNKPDGRIILIHEAFAKSLIDHLKDPQTGRIRLNEMTAVCLEPYYEHGYPMMMAVMRAIEIVKESLV